MKRYVLVLMTLMLLTVPMVVGADDQGWMPSEWTATPPARPMVDVMQLMQLLVAKGVITDQEYAQLIQPQSAAPSPSAQARVGVGEQVSRRPVLNNR